MNERPSISVTSHATVGEVVYFKERVPAETGVRIDQPIQETFGLGAQISLPRDAILVPATTQNRSAYCSKDPAYIEPLGAHPTRSVCFFDENDDGQLDHFWVVGTLSSTSRSIPETPISRKTKRLGREGFRKELIFQGISNNVLRFRYREYSDTLIRPAFSQDLTYTYKSLPTEIAFRSLAIKIHLIEGNSIKYTVSKSLKRL